MIALILYTMAQGNCLGRRGCFGPQWRWKLYYTIERLLMGLFRKNMWKSSVWNILRYRKTATRGHSDRQESSSIEAWISKKSGTSNCRNEKCHRRKSQLTETNLFIQLTWLNLTPTSTSISVAPNFLFRIPCFNSRVIQFLFRSIVVQRATNDTFSFLSRCSL